MSEIEAKRNRLSALLDAHYVLYQYWFREGAQDRGQGVPGCHDEHWSSLGWLRTIPRATMCSNRTASLGTKPRSLIIGAWSTWPISGLGPRGLPQAQIAILLTKASCAWWRGRPVGPTMWVWTPWRLWCRRSGPSCLSPLRARRARPSGRGSRPCWRPMVVILSFKTAQTFAKSCANFHCSTPYTYY